MKKVKTKQNNNKNKSQTRSKYLQYIYLRKDSYLVIQQMSTNQKSNCKSNLKNKQMTQTSTALEKLYERPINIKRHL